MKNKNNILEKFYSPQTNPAVVKTLRKRKFKIYDERVIPYVESPTKRAYLGVAKNPLIAVKNGFGYMGVLLQTDNRELVQCHICGKWAKSITARHLEAHKVTKEQYNRRFGLYFAQALISDALSYSLAERGRKNITRFNLTGQTAESRKKAAERLRKHQTSKTSLNSDQWKNKFGTCEKQIGYRIVEYVKKYHELPGTGDKGEGYKISKILTKRYGSVNNGFKHYKLPARYRKGTSVELVAPDQTSLHFNYNKPSYNREKIYQWIYEKCPHLHPDAINIYAD